MLSRIEVITAGGILLALCLGGTAAADATAPDASAPLPGPEPLDWLPVAVMPLVLGLFVWRRWYDLRRAPRPAAVFSPPVGAAMFLAMLVLGLGGALIVRNLLGIGAGGDDGADLGVPEYARILLGGVAAQAVGVVAYAWCARRAPSRGPGPVRAALAGAGALLLVWPVMAATAFASGLVAERITGAPVEPVAHQTLQLLVESPADRWMAVLVATVLVAVPVVEEVMYRGILQQMLVEVVRSRWLAIVLASAAFTLMHEDAVAGHALPALFVLSVGFGWIYERTGRLSACITMHALFNAVNVVLTFLSAPGT